MENKNWIKKTALVVMAVLVLAGCSKIGGGAVKENPASDFSYELTNDKSGIRITRYTGLKEGGSGRTNVVIPATIEDMPVLEIGRTAFHGSSLDIRKITKVTLPDSIVRIGGQAFEFCENLTLINLPASLEEIGESAFWGTSLTSVNMQSNRLVIGEKAFFACEKLTSVKLPLSFVSIGAETFNVCGELTDLIIPDSLTSVEFPKGFYNRAFKGCQKLPLATRQKIQDLGYTSDF